jgi:hypothetical protein
MAIQVRFLPVRCSKIAWKFDTGPTSVPLGWGHRPIPCDLGQFEFYTEFGRRSPVLQSSCRTARIGFVRSSPRPGRQRVRREDRGEADGPARPFRP